MQNLFLPYDVSTWHDKKPRFYDVSPAVLMARLLPKSAVADVMFLFTSGSSPVHRECPMEWKRPMRSMREAYVRLKLLQFEHRSSKKVLSLKMPSFVVRYDIIHTFLAMLHVHKDATTKLEPRGLPAVVFCLRSSDIQTLRLFVDMNTERAQVVIGYDQAVSVCPVIPAWNCAGMKTSTDVFSINNIKERLTLYKSVRTVTERDDDGAFLERIGIDRKAHFVQKVLPQRLVVFSGGQTCRRFTPPV